MTEYTRKRSINAISNYKILMLSSIYILLVGCAIFNDYSLIGSDSSKDKYIPAVPDNIRFVVVPFNDYLPQIQFAADVENFLIQVGLNVVAAPRGIKLVEERKGAGVTQDTDTSNLSSSSIQREETKAQRIEKYAIAQEAKADYIIETMLNDSDDSGTIKITRKNDSKIIGVFSTYRSGYSFNAEMTDQFVKMGFIAKVNEGVTPKIKNSHNHRETNG